MKFGKRLAAEAARCWPEACLDYKAIKRALKHDLAAAGKQCRKIPPTGYSWLLQHAMVTKHQAACFVCGKNKF
jgi:hypothetical protein